MFGISASIKAIAALVIVLVIAVGVWYVTGLRADLAVSENNSKTLQDSLKVQSALISQMQNDIVNIQNINRELQDQTLRQQKELKSMSDKFNLNAKGEARDFGALAAAKPALVERLVNRGSQNVARCFELASGAPLNDKEKQAKTPEEANRECPSLINPNFKPILP